MAKGTYLKKHRERTGDEIRIKSTPVLISDEQRALYEEGKVLLIDKPLHWTSFDAVRKIRNSLRIKKVGHAGTLDPLATGLLIICTGKFTKKINEYMAQEKEYTGSITLGATTPTYDLESLLENQKDIGHLNEETLRSTVLLFTGAIMQKPPVYSAIKKEGTASYELARRGEEVEMKERPVTISAFEITSIDLPVVRFRIVCSTGTYIRSIANDYGASLGCGGYLSELRRTRIGSFRSDEAMSIEEFIQKLQNPV